MDKKKSTIKVFTMFFVVVYVFSWGAVDGEEIRCIERERKALLRFKEDIIDEFSVLSSWGSGEDKWECCKWNGILCSNKTRHVISVELVGLVLREDGQYKYRPLRGNISSALALLELRHLMSLVLNHNDFSGEEIPEFIGSFDKLKHLNLGNCKFGGIVPHQLGNLTNLMTLELGNNDGLKIDNLKWLSHLSSLSLLDLSYVNFTQSFDTVLLQNILTLPSLMALALSSSTFPNVASSFDVLANSTSTSLFILDLSNIGLTSFTFHWLFNVTKSLVVIDLSGNQFDGSIPDGFGKQIFLEVLDLLDNRLEGGIPKSLWNSSSLEILRASNNHLSEAFSDSFLFFIGEEEVSLQILDLSGNQITGSFPDLRRFSVLRELHLGNNRLKNLPANVGEFSKLLFLDVSYNSFEGTLFEANLSKLHSLKVLDLSFNSLLINFTNDWIPPFQLGVLSLARCGIGPHFPEWLETQSSLSLLDLSFNNISDKLPNWFWDFSFRLYDLDLSHNQISGKLPDLFSKYIPEINLSFNNFSGLVPKFHPNSMLLQLSNNMFEGPISSLCSATYDSLAFLDLSNNQLSGVLPNCWQNMALLSVLNLVNNNFSGEIPHTLGSLKDLLRLHLRNNSLSGMLPFSLKNCKSLAMIDVGGNELTGNIPAWIGSHLTGLIILSIRSNRFNGSIPPELCHLTRIQILDLSRNNLSGRIPSQCFNNFTSLVRENNTSKSALGLAIKGYHHTAPIDMIDNALVQWKQQEFEYRKALPLLTLIDFSSNKIMGDIPPEIFQMRGLLSLNLSRNHLTGNISSDIGQMKNLECLDLSRNHLSGKIPIGLGMLTFLAFLDLSNNNLSGRIPSGTQLQSFNASSFASNTGLCGPPLKRCPEDELSTSSGNHDEHDNGDDFTTQSILEEFYIPVVLGFILGFWGIIATLILNHSWRHAYFNFFNNITDWVYVKAAIYATRLLRRREYGAIEDARNINRRQ